MIWNLSWNEYILKLEDEVKVFCYGYIKKLFLFLWNKCIYFKSGINMLVFYLLVNLVLDRRIFIVNFDLCLKFCYICYLVWLVFVCFYI